MSIFDTIRGVLGFGGSPASGSVIRDTVNQLKGEQNTGEVLGKPIYNPTTDPQNPENYDMYKRQGISTQRYVDSDNPYTERTLLFNILPNGDEYTLKQDQYGNNPRLYVTYDLSGKIKSVKGIDDIAALNEDFAKNISFRDGDFGTNKVENTKKYNDFISSLYSNGYHINAGTTGITNNRYRNLDYYNTFGRKTDEGNV